VFDWLCHGLNPLHAFGWSMRHSFKEEHSSASPPQRALEPQLLSELQQSVTLTQLHSQTSTFSHHEGHHLQPQWNCLCANRDCGEGPSLKARLLYLTRHPSYMQCFLSSLGPHLTRKSGTGCCRTPGSSHHCKF